MSNASIDNKDTLPAETLSELDSMSLWQVSDNDCCWMERECLETTQQTENTNKLPPTRKLVFGEVLVTVALLIVALSMQAEQSPQKIQEKEQVYQAVSTVYWR